MSATIGIIIDVIIIALFVIFGLIGLKKGFFKSVLSVFSFGLCLVIACLLAKYVAGWLNALYDFSGLIGGKISDNLIKTDAFFAQSVNVYESAGADALIASIPDSVNNLLLQIVKMIFTHGKVDMSSADSIGSIVGSSLGHICMILISGVLTFIVIRIAIALLTRLLNDISKIKVIGGLNKILGLLLGFVKAALIVFVLNVGLTALSLIPPVNKVVLPVIQENTYVEKAVYNVTGDLFEKYVIEGDELKDMVKNLWEKR